VEKSKNEVGVGEDTGDVGERGVLVLFSVFDLVWSGKKDQFKFEMMAFY